MVAAVSESLHGRRSMGCIIASELSTSCSQQNEYYDLNY